MQIATIGFTKSTAESFFSRIRKSGLPLVVDIRVHNRSQLAGFAKQPDLTYFLRELCDVECIEEPMLTPTEDLVAAYRGKNLSGDEFFARYRALLDERDATGHLDRQRYEAGAILLCSEVKADHCHRRIAAEYLAEQWQGVTIDHI